MLKKIWQRIGYYFRIDFHTIQGRLTGGFMTLAFMAGCVVAFNHLQWQRLSRDRDYILSTIDPSMQLVQHMTLEIERTYDYVANPIQHRPQDRDSAWAQRILPFKDSLENFMDSWDRADGAVDELYYACSFFINDVEHIKQEQNHLIQNSMSPPPPKVFFENVQYSSKQLLNRLHVFRASQELSSAGLIRQMNWIIVFSFVLAFIMALVLGGMMVSNVLMRIRRLKRHIKQIAAGDLPETIPPSRDELNTIVRSLNELVDNLRQITNFAGDVGGGKFDSEISVFNNEGSLGASLGNMRESLLKVAKENDQRRWFNEGIAQFADLMRKHNDNLDELCDQVVRHLVHYLKATQGGVFVAKQEEFSDEVLLEMRGLYAYDRKKFMNWTIRPGQGLAGQAYREKAPVLLKEVPQDYTEVSSGLGDATPNFIAIMPMISNETIYGVIEIASFSELAEHELEFYEKVSENIAAAIASVKISQETNRLLEESQLATEQLRAQEEEMRQNAEELQATQEEIHRQMREASEQRDMFISLLENVDGIIYRSKYDEVWTKIYLSDNVEQFTGYHSSLFLEKGKSFGEIIHPEDLESVNTRNLDSLAQGKPWRLEYRIIRRDGKVIWVEEKGKGVYDDEGKVRFIDGIIVDVTKRKAEASTKASATA